jgi:hypothetical protein
MCTTPLITRRSSTPCVPRRRRGSNGLSPLPFSIAEPIKLFPHQGLPRFVSLESQLRPCGNPSLRPTLATSSRAAPRSLRSRSTLRSRYTLRSGGTLWTRGTSHSSRTLSTGGTGRPTCRLKAPGYQCRNDGSNDPCKSYGGPRNSHAASPRGPISPIAGRRIVKRPFRFIILRGSVWARLKVLEQTALPPRSDERADLAQGSRCQYDVDRFPPGRERRH